MKEKKTIEIKDIDDVTDKLDHFYRKRRHAESAIGR